MIEAIIILFGVLLTRFVLRPPEGLRIIAWVNFVIFVAFSIAFSRVTGGAASGVDALKFYSLGTLKIVGDFENFSQANFVFFVSNKLQSLVPMSYTAFNLFAAVFFSHTALLLILRRLENPSQRLIWFWWILTLLPGFHFWHASFGKESMQLHIALAIGIAEILANLFSKKVTFQRVFIIIGGALVALSVLTYLINRISGGEEGLNFVEVWALFQDYGSGWREGDLRLNDTASPLAPIEFLLRPYFWEISGPAVFISWIDSTVMTVAGVYLLLQVPFLDKPIRMSAPHTAKSRFSRLPQSLWSAKPS